jgi:hypothetical protein
METRCLRRTNSIISSLMALLSWNPGYCMREERQPFLLRESQPFSYVQSPLLAGISKYGSPLLFKANQDLYQKILREAIKKNLASLVYLLIQHVPCADLHNLRIWPLLHIACGCGHRKIAQLLVQKGFSLDAQDDTGRTPIDEARRRWHKDLARFLSQESASF